ncbi:MAG: hypothetical protein OXQ90_00200 [Gammaproteobacteria bacterium]|nr:hypothetical protein [Gammaproteobacteria bacterium]
MDALITALFLLALAAMGVSIGGLWSSSKGRVRKFRRVLVGSYALLILMIPAAATRPVSARDSR